MRSLNRLVVLLCVAVLLSGCVKFKTDVVIKDDSTIILSLEYGADKAKDPQFQGQRITKDNACQIGPHFNVPGATHVPIETADTVGCRISLRGGLASFSQTGMIRREGRVYYFRFGGSELEGLPQSPEEVVDFQASVTFPDKVLTHNGSSTVSGTTVTWDDPRDLLAGNGLEASGEVKQMPLLPWLIAALVTLLTATGFVVVTGRRDRQAYARAAAYAPMPRWGEPGNRGELPPSYHP